MNHSPLIQNAKGMIASVEGKTLSHEERKNAAIKLADMMLKEARRIQKPHERKQQHELARMLQSPIGKVFTTVVTDQCFRSRHSWRVADQLTYTIKKYGIPQYLSLDKRAGLFAFKILGRPLSPIMVPLAIQSLRQETSSVILPGEPNELISHMKRRRLEGVRINLNHLGEAILGEEEALHRLNVYLKDLSDPYVEYISIKISTIFSQINLLAWNETIEILADRLRQLYRAAMKNEYVRADGVKVPKFVNLDMEEYRDLNLTVELFRKVLDEPEFFHHEAGIVLQGYLPDAFLIQQELTVWAMKRVASGGAPIKIRIVKGANLAMEQVESALKLWPQAPYNSKLDVDANYKRMVIYGTQKEHAQAAHLGIASHNLFDIAYALFLRAENCVEQYVCFEMLEGMADHMRRVVQQLSGDMLLYCPAATKEEFQNAVAYLVRRLDENTAPENFLRHAFDLVPGTKIWDSQATLFSNACSLSDKVSYVPRRTQDRNNESFESCDQLDFKNEPDTDWSLPQNRIWAEKILLDWKQKVIKPVPLVINGKIIESSEERGIGVDPSNPSHELYKYSLASLEQVEIALVSAKEAEKKWAETYVHDRSQLLAEIAKGLRKHRADLIGVMIADTGKTVPEADVEISEAIDFAEYYRHNIEDWSTLHDIRWHPKGTVLVTPPWNFPCSIPAGGILAALAAGNCVIFKPAPEAVLVGWTLAQIFWEAGVNKNVMQFITCVDEPVGSKLIQDSRVNAVILTGATSTAKLFLRLRPGLDLIAETGGKNAMVITAMSDRDLAIKDLIHSAFGHAGQKCSACSLAILEAEVYDDPHFRRQLRDAAASLALGSAWDVKTRVNPLIQSPNPILLRGLTQLDDKEEWLLEPRQYEPNLWSPGIKLGVQPNSFTFQNELFGPVLGLVRAENFSDALNIMNQTSYGLTAGIHSLDEREQKTWLKRIKAGNCYINRTITGAIVQRQPFGGCKESSFGRGAKAGGPNYLTQLMVAEQIALPKEQECENHRLRSLTKSLGKENYFGKNQQVWESSLKNYAFYWKHYFSKKHDPSLVLGQDNFQEYTPHSKLTFRVQDGDSDLDTLRVIAAAITCRTTLEISADKSANINFKKLLLPSNVVIFDESENEFINRLDQGSIKRVRLLKEPAEFLQNALGMTACHLNVGSVLANGRLELLHYLREVSVSHDYHRYGNLGDRENERRAPLPGTETNQNIACGACSCHE
ncbi:MAG: bifunctional proline dehydrogenase/L-glutamate gamma-semialdehyde dehydrogenase [Parachlamydiaceae bacterium]|nr:bifunctional proline dehydrogenase/L-glutamate gamma-semialdehyde dehydrogenase [Parachlamydiaceae bacterium]